MIDAAPRDLLVAWLSGGAAALMSPRSPRGVKRRVPAAMSGMGDDDGSAIPHEPKRQASASSDIDTTADLDERSASSTASLAWSIDELMLHAMISRVESEAPSAEVEAAAGI